MLEIILNSLPIFVVILLGVYLRRYGGLDRTAVKVVSTIAFKISIPFLFVKAMYGQSITEENIIFIVVPLIFGVLMLLFGYLLTRFLKLNRKESGVVIPAMSGFAIGSFAYPFVLSNFSDGVFKDLVITDIFIFLIILTLGYFVAVSYSTSEKDWRAVSNRIIRNPIVISMIFIIVVVLMDIQLPDTFIALADFISRPFTFLASLLIGLTLTLPSRKRIRLISTLFFSRLLFIGLLIFLSLFFISQYQSAIFILAFAVPFSTLPLIYAEELDLDIELASQMSLFSILVSIIFYPAVIIFVNTLI